MQLKRWMNRSNGLVVVVTVLVTLMCLGLSGDGTKKKKTRGIYEYCMLQIVEIEGKYRSAYTSRDGKRVMAKDMSELYSKLGLGGEGGILQFMNYLGSRRWKLVEIDDEAHPKGHIHTYYFQRTKL